jgi:hypothetical protein
MRQKHGRFLCDAVFLTRNDPLPRQASDKHARKIVFESDGGFRRPRIVAPGDASFNSADEPPQMSGGGGGGGGNDAGTDARKKRATFEFERCSNISFAKTGSGDTER